MRGAAAGAFLCTTNRGKLLQHKLIHVQCTKKSTLGIRFKNVNSDMVSDMV